MQHLLLSWSSGKDSAWTLCELRRRADIEVCGLVTTVNRDADRVAMHAVRRELLEQQADAAALPLDVVLLPHPCSNADYEAAMRHHFSDALQRGMTGIAYGDLALADVRAYRERLMAGTGLDAHFPLWGRDTRTLARDMLDGGLRARITCIDPKQMPARFAGREFDTRLLDELPEHIDACGENGEFHTFVTHGPMFDRSIDVIPGDTVERDGFLFSDLKAVQQRRTGNA